jgi:SAM-dependent methyltransferase
MTAKQHNHFETDGANYAKFRPTYPENLALQLSNLCHTHDCAIDIGCGTGQLTGLLTNRFERVIGLDPSQTAIDHATPHDKITYLKGAAEETLQPDQSVDLIVAAQAAHWFDMPNLIPKMHVLPNPKPLLRLYHTVFLPWRARLAHGLSIFIGMIFLNTGPKSAAMSKMDIEILNWAIGILIRNVLVSS